MQANQQSVIWSVIIVGVVLLIAISMGLGNANIPEVPTAEAIGAVTAGLIVMPTAPTCPTAEDIVSLIEMPEAENVAGWQDFFEDYFGEEYSDIKDNAYDDVISEIEEDDYEALEDFLKANIEGFDELTSVNEDEDETEITVIKLGLEEDEDKEAQVYLEFKIKYTLEEGDDTKYKDTVTVNAEVLYDEGDFDDEDVDVEYTL